MRKKTEVLKVELEKTGFWLTSPYDAKFVSMLKLVGRGKWDPTTKRWRFPITALEAVRLACMEMWGKLPEEEILPEKDELSASVKRFFDETFRKEEDVTPFSRAMELAGGLALLVPSLSEQEKEFIYDKIFHKEPVTWELPEIEL